MPSEKALAIPFEAGEIIDILCDEFRKRLAANCHLQGRREYASFRAHFDIGMTLRTVAGEPIPTIAWDKPYREARVPDTEGETVMVSPTPDEFTSADPNTERMKRGMPLTVQDKRGNRRKVRVNDAKAVSRQPKVDEDDGA